MNQYRKVKMQVNKLFISCLLVCMGNLIFQKNSACYAQENGAQNLQNGPAKFYHANGKVSSEGTMLNGKPDGYWKTYYENGILKSEGNRKNFQLDSIWKFYSQEGALVSEFNYLDGKKGKRYNDV